MADAYVRCPHNSIFCLFRSDEMKLDLAEVKEQQTKNLFSLTNTVKERGVTGVNISLIVNWLK